MKGVVVTTDNQVEIRDFGEPLYKTVGEAVGGYIETVTLDNTGLVVICNEEGRLRDLPYNCEVCGIDFVGPIVFAEVDGEEFASIEQEAFRLAFPELWKGAAIDG